MNNKTSRINSFVRSVLPIFAAVCLHATAAISQAGETISQRERLLLDFGWKFHLGNQWGIAQNLAKSGTGSGPASMTYSDASWRNVNLPHDWAIELPFDKKADAGHGFKALGPNYESNSIAWYRRTFTLPKEDQGKRLWIEFDGAFRDCTVFVNGWFVGHHESGYSSFRYDITDVANCGGKNVVSVKVDATQFEGWFYEGAGIYRHVWLVKTSPVAIAPDGIFVYSRFKNNVPQDKVDIHIEARLLNSQSVAADAKLHYDIINPGGKSVGSFQQGMKLQPLAKSDAKSLIKLSKPDLWSPESPSLYKLITTVESGGKVVDRIETEFGIKTVAFDADKGFFLNGKPYVLKGTCNHQDHAGVGAALPDRLQYFRIERLKEMGCNSYRCSHNPPTPELLEACDRLGMLVMDEPRVFGSDSINLDRLERLVRRDRNHASVGIWSIGNEEFTVQLTHSGKLVGAAMQDFVRQLDPTRPITYPAPVGNEFKGVNEIIEVRGWNYKIDKNTDAYHKEHPTQPNVGTEQGSTVTTRGIYITDKAAGYLTAYDTNVTSWSHTAEQWWTFFAERPWLSGGFVWTGFDYRGEPTPYKWPCINSHFGILDMCGFPKDNFWYYQSWWTDKPVLHLLPHWTWPGREEETLDVRALSNCEEVELFLNGESLGRKLMKKNSHLRWDVKYAPGTLSAKGYREGKVIAEEKVETTGEPAAVRFTPDRAAINADGEDISILTVSVLDAKGRTIPIASNMISFELSGPGKIIGVGNGDPSCHEPDVYLSLANSRSIDMNYGWKTAPIRTVYETNSLQYKTDFDDSDWEVADPRVEGGPLGPRGQAFYRMKFKVKEEDLAADTIELNFGMIDEDGWIYVNGQKAGESHEWRSPTVVNVKPYLHVGENIVAVGVANYDEAGGMNKGVTLRIQTDQKGPTWQRSVFNGLAQVIVQSSKEAGEIKLRAKGEGLSDGTVVITTKACTPRPAVQ